jgi:methylglutaconyl-CoA hydratase
MKNIKIEKNESFFKLTLNRPEKRNALNEELMLELTQNLKTLNIEHQKYLVLTGEGHTFCSGADINWMKSMADFSFDENKKDSEKLFDLFNALYNFKLPVISLVKGAAFGGALGLIAASDFVFMDENTKLCFSEVKLGLSPAVISTFVLNKTNQLNSYVLSGQLFSEKEALTCGLSNGYLEDFESLTQSLMQSGQEALIQTKVLLKKQNPLLPESYKDLTTETIAKLRITEEAQKRMKSFLNKK